MVPTADFRKLYAGAHKDVVRGVRWLGPTARIVSFSSEKAAHGYRNTLLLTDIRNRSSLPFREVGAEGAPMLGIRASPLGRYILILLRGAPSEIWAVSQHDPLSTAVQCLQCGASIEMWVVTTIEQPLSHWLLAAYMMVLSHLAFWWLQKSTEISMV